MGYGLKHFLILCGIVTCHFKNFIQLNKWAGVVAHACKSQLLRGGDQEGHSLSPA
jgi:hypothetical protein